MTAEQVETIFTLKRFSRRNDFHDETIFTIRRTKALIMGSNNMTYSTKNSVLKTIGKTAVAALFLSAPLFAAAVEPASSPSCNSVMTKTKEFRDAPKEQIQGICKTNRNSQEYWSCMNKRIDKGQGFADAGMRCNKISKVVTASR